MITVLKKEIKIFPEDEKTNIVLPFTVENSAKFIKITYSYSPKILEDDEKAKAIAEECLSRDAGEFKEKYPPLAVYLPLKNLVTVSLDSPDGYRGAAHRHNPEQKHILSEKSASPGFFKGKITAGEWKITLNVHAVVTEECICKLKIETGSDAYE